MNEVDALSNRMADAVERAGPAVVRVNGRSRYAASGVVHVAEVVVVADHALERDEDLTVDTHDGRTLAAHLVGRDPSTDLAVLRVAGLALAAAVPAAGRARVGQLALALGRPSRQGLMASLGIVSAVGGPLRAARGAVLEQAIRTDATPYPGFSGGPLIDGSGGVLGILTTGLIRGVALAVPTAVAWRVAETLTRHGHVKRGYLGIGGQPVRIPEAQRAAEAPDRGLLIVAVSEGSPAERGGLLLGDIVIALAGHPVADIEDLQALLAEDRVGAMLAVEVIRGGARRNLTVTIGSRPTASS